MAFSLNSPQLKAVQSTSQNLLVLAGAGSGKTRVITEKISHLILQGVSPYNILAITFTNKAAGEMRNRVFLQASETQKSLLTIKTFHAFCAFILRSFVKEIGLFTSNFTIIDEEDKKAIFKKLFGEQYDSRERKSLVNIISQWKNDGLQVTAEEKKFNLYQCDNLDSGDVLKCYRKYQSELIKNNSMDFDDLLLYCHILLSRSEVAKKYLITRWKYLLIDEYQDTNPSQELLVEYFYLGKSQITVVGDDDQSIYSFRGASIDNIRNFPQKYQPCEVIPLEENYRSTSHILNFANESINHNHRIFEKKLFTQNQNGKLPQLHYFNNEQDEARFICETIEQDLLDKVTANEIAIIYRTNYQSRIIEQKLTQKGISYQLIGGLKFYQRKEIKDLLAYLILAINPQDQNALLRIINYPPRGIGKKNFDLIRDNISKQEGDVIQYLKENAIAGIGPGAKKGLSQLLSLYQEPVEIDNSNSVIQWVKNIYLASGMQFHLESLPDEYERDNRLGNIQQLFQAIEDFFVEQNTPQNIAESNKKDFSHFLQEASLLSGADEKQNEGVNLITAHYSKGLEFEKVYLRGLEQSSFPHYLAYDYPEQIEEERRLFYVSITRAKKQLILSTSYLKRNYSGKNETCSPSNFLLEIPSDQYQLIDHTHGMFSSFLNMAEEKKNVSDDDEIYQDIPDDHEYF